MGHQIVAESLTTATIYENVYNYSLKFVLQTVTFRNFVHSFHHAQSMGSKGAKCTLAVGSSSLTLLIEKLVEEKHSTFHTLHIRQKT